MFEYNKDFGKNYFLARCLPIVLVASSSIKGSGEEGLPLTGCRVKRTPFSLLPEMDIC
jgi:hypothetical protein